MAVWQFRSRSSVSVALATGILLTSGSVTYAQDARTVAPSQVGNEQDAKPDLSQISDVRRTTAVEQASTSIPTTETGQLSILGDRPDIETAGSSSADSAPRAEAPLEGSDACDLPEDVERPSVCTRTVESRSEEFARPSVLLVVDTDIADTRASGSLDEIDRLATQPGMPTADTPGAQALASITLGEQAPPPPEAPTGLPDLPGQVIDIVTGSGLIAGNGK